MFNGNPIAPPVAAPQAGISMTGMGQLAYLLNNLPGLMTALRGGPFGGQGQGQAMQGQAGGLGAPGGGLGGAPGGGMGAPGVPGMGQQPPQAPAVPPAPQNLGGGLRQDMLQGAANNAPNGLGPQNPVIQALMEKFMGAGQGQMLDPRLRMMMGRYGG